MALRVWLPLNGDLNNQGLDGGVTVTNNGATVDATGKIGSCYNFGDGTETNKGKGINLDSNLLYLGPNRSICAWVRPKGNHLHYAGAIVSSGNWNNKRWSFGVKQDNTGFTGFDSSYSTYYRTSIPVNTWTHLCVTVEGNITKFYKNGIYLGQSSRGSVFDSDAQNTMVGRETYASGYFSFNGDINDVRIYDHCLSPKEVKEISKGLVLHYKLDVNPNIGVGGVNLVANGWGGTKNWNGKAGAYISSTEIPETPTGITHSYSSSNYTTEFIPIISNHSYTMSAYVKKNSSSASNCYLTLVPFDIDKNQIQNYMQRDGFVTASLTTLAQDLHNGDTIIYLTDASGWTTTSTYAYRVAIFGYQDSTGYTYPDMVYTRRVYAFGTRTDKSNLDIPGNKVTLRAAYSGPTIPAGTSICQTSDGSGYYYPAYCQASAATDWKLLTKTFTPNSVNYLKAAKYVRVMSLSSYQWLAGITLVDNTAATVVEDVSGYGNNGTITGQLTVSTDTPRYGKCAEFDGVTSGIQIDNLYISNIINTAVTYSFWIKPNGENGARSVYFGSYSSTSWSIEKYTNNLLRSWWNGALNYYPNVNIIDNTWQMITITKNGTNDVKFYLNGELKDTNTSTHSALTFPTTFRIGRDIRSGDGTPYKGLMSDFRIYSTALSADDILELYNTAAVIDNGGTVYGYEFDEDSSSEIDKSGILKFNMEERGRDTDTTIYSQVQVNLLQNTIIDNFRYERISGAGTETGKRFTPTVQLETNKNYTFSAMIRGSANLNLYTINTGGNMAFTYVNKENMSTQEFKLFSVTFKVTGDRTINQVYLCTRYGEANTAVGDWFEVQANSVKLEEESMCTPWTPATSDSVYRNYDKLLSASQIIEY